MLFDLRGRGRRRVVQVVYLGLALLLGGGLVLFELSILVSAWLNRISPPGSLWGEDDPSEFEHADHDED